MKLVKIVKLRVEVSGNIDPSVVDLAAEQALSSELIINDIDFADKVEVISVEASLE